MSEAVKMVVTITDVSGQPWNKPGSEQYWYSVAIKELGEPVKFIRDKSKGAPAPVNGETYQGNMYDGNKFYAFGNQPIASAVQEMIDDSGSRERVEEIIISQKVTPSVINEPKPATDFVPLNKDEQITKNMVWKNLLGQYDIPSMEFGSEQWESLWGNVELHTLALLGRPLPTEEHKAGTNG